MPGCGILFVVSGPSGVGKSSIVRAVLQTFPDVRLSISCTTRPPRPGEENGREYWFITKADFRRMIEQKEFAEWAEVYGQMYGTPWRELMGGKEKGQDVILDIDVQGARQICQQLPDAVSVFLLPPSLEILQSRLRGRRTDSPDVVEYRFQQARKEMQHYRDYEYVIRNDTLAQASKEFEAIVMAERIRTKRIDQRWLMETGLTTADGTAPPATS